MAAVNWRPAVAAGHRRRILHYCAVVILTGYGRQGYMEPVYRFNGCHSTVVDVPLLYAGCDADAGSFCMCSCQIEVRVLDEKVVHSGPAE